jgi:hypothetical protein
VRALRAARRLSVRYVTDHQSFPSHNTSLSEALPAQAEGSALRDFQVFVTDDRYAVPTLHIVLAESAESACAMAERLLESSPHHLGVEVYERDLRVLAIGAVGSKEEPDATATVTS